MTIGLPYEIETQPQISWVVNNVEYPLEDGENIFLLSYDGFGIPEFHRFEERGPLQHGVTDRGYRLDARTIVLVVGISGNKHTNFYNKQQELLNIFKPSDNPGILRFKLGDITREISGYLIGGLELSGSDREYLYQKSAITIKCPDPAWYDPLMDTSYFSIGGGTDALYIPMEVPFDIGTSTINMSQSVTYNGTVNSYPIIKITGPIKDCMITNESTGDKLDFTGTTIPAGVTYTINLNYGYKTIIDSTGVNRISQLSSDSDLASFSIEPHPIVAGGINSISLTGTDVTETTAVEISYYERYIAV